MTPCDMTPNEPPPVPLRTILRNFLNHVDNYELTDSYDKEFQELKQLSESLKGHPDYLCSEGEKSVNRKKNRYKDILPFDATRVILTDVGDIPGSDYINASFIKGASGSSAYIACQGPLPHTVSEFWRMVVECEVQVIVMACNEQESGKHKCENYWVSEMGEEREFGQVKISLKKCRQVCPDFLVRTMSLCYTNGDGGKEERNVCQFHYSAWPDHGVPTKVRPLLDMVRLMRDCQTSETLPVLVHCSAGCGRTGTICAIDYVWGLLRLGKLTPDFSLFNLVRDMRRQRIAMVQTKDQYVMVHRAVKELFEEQLKIIDSHPYANVDAFGLPLPHEPEVEPMYETVEYQPLPPSKKAPPPPLSPTDDITVLSDEEPPEKGGRGVRGILRKPSLVKIRSFFENSKKVTRTKSDASSRFYVWKKPSSGPSLFRPLVKRSKSLKISPAEAITTAASSTSSSPVMGKAGMGSERPKPNVPPKSEHVLRVKMGLAREMEDTLVGPSKKKQQEDSLKSCPLTRSQSHVWGGNSGGGSGNNNNPPLRIFSHETIPSLEITTKNQAIEPTAKRRVPKTNPYANYTPPRGNSSESSNRSTPTQTLNSSSTPKKSILKGSLSSTPSESDDTMIAVRPRRNSFRKAVIKDEEAPRGYKDYEPIWPEHNPYVKRLQESQQSQTSRQLQGTTPEFQARLDQIQLLLEELKAPSLSQQQESHNNHSNPPQNHATTTSSSNTTPNNAVPSSSSCFTWKTSLESLTDHYSKPASLFYTGDEPPKAPPRTRKLQKSNTISIPKSEATQPKHIIKALGLFQAKAANVREKLSKNQQSHNNVAQDLDGGFGSNASRSGGSSRPPRQQYL